MAKGRRIIFLVEGAVDRTLIEETISRFNIKDKFAVAACDGKGIIRKNIKTHLRSHLGEAGQKLLPKDNNTKRVSKVKYKDHPPASTSINDYLGPLIRNSEGRILVAEDLDESIENQILTKYSRLLKIKEESVDQVNKTIPVGDNAIYFLFFGIPNKEFSEGFSYNQAVIEDHLINILFEDDDLIKKVSQSKVINDSKTLVNKLTECNKEMIQGGLKLQNSKELLELVKLVIKQPVAPATLVERIIRNSDEKILEKNIKNIITFLKKF